MIELYIPKLEDLRFRQKMLADPETMSYNAHYPIDDINYHPDTGCIDFFESQWNTWFSKWIHQEDRFYAYIRRKSDGAFVGEVNVHPSPSGKHHEFGIVIDAPYRGMGYAVPALTRLIDMAFFTYHAECLRNNFEIERNEIAAWRTLFSVGFREFSREDGILSLYLTKDNWYDIMDAEDEDAENEEEHDPFYSFRMRF